MRAAIIALALAVAPEAFAQVNTLQNIGLSLQALAASTQLSISIAQLAALCRQDRDCDQGARCHLIDGRPGRCVWRQSLQPECALFLRDRTTQLREELALGEGPVTTWLATTRGVSPVMLGRAMRTHRSELVALIGETSGTEWTIGFLRRLEELEQEGDLS